MSLCAARRATLWTATTLLALGCGRPSDAPATVRPAAPAAAAPPSAKAAGEAGAKAPGQAAGAKPADAKRRDKRQGEPKGSGPQGGQGARQGEAEGGGAAARALPAELDVKDLDAAECAVLDEILDEQFDPCGKPRSLRAALVAGDCALATRLARFVVEKLQQGYGKRKIVGLLLREVERLNTVVTIDTSAAPRLGPADAKVEVVVFSDFECPFCRRAAAPLARLQRHYGVALRYLHYPLKANHPYAEGAARAAWAAQRQGKFWQMHDALFEHAPALRWEQVQGYARAIGLDLKRFIADADSEAAKAAVERDLAQGRKAGVDGTPIFYVNGRRAETLEQVQEGIREALGLAGVKALPPTIDVSALDAGPAAAPEAAPAAPAAAR
jgi:protein-disulfide isomerase